MMKTKMKHSQHLLLIALLLLVSSCNNSTNPEKPEQIDIPFDVGYKIIFDVFAINDETPVYNMDSKDSMECTSIDKIDGHDVYIFEQKDENGVNVVAEKYYFEDNILFLHSDFIDKLLAVFKSEIGVNMPLKPNIEWINFIEFGKDKWVIAQDSVTNYYIDDGQTALAKGLLTIEGEMLGTEMISIKGAEHPVQKYKISTVFEGDFVNQVNGYAGDLSANIDIIQYFSQDFGKVRTLYKKSKVIVGEMDIDFFGYGTFTIFE